MTTRCMAGVELWAIMELETSHELPWCHCKTVHVALCKKQQLSVVGTCCRCVFNYWCHVLYGRFIPIKVQTRMATDLENTAQGQKMNKLCLLGPKERSPSEARKWASTGSRGCAVFGIPWRKAIPFVGSCWCNVAQVLINANNNDIKHSSKLLILNDSFGTSNPTMVQKHRYSVNLLPLPDVWEYSDFVSVSHACRS